MYKHDYKYSFSSAKKTSAYIQKMNLLNETPIICQNTAMPTISSYTGNKYIEINTLSESSFCHWNNNPFLLNNIAVHYKLKEYFEQHKTKTVIYVAQNELTLFKLNNNYILKYSLINSFTKSIVKQENYYVYLVQKIK